MDSGKLKGQIAVITAAALLFAVFDAGLYLLFTRRYEDRSPELMVAKSIELDKYLPFDEKSRIVRLETDFQMDRELPVLDGATALFPIYSAVMNSVYPEGSCEFDGSDFSEASLLQKRGTTEAYKAIVDGTADIIFVAQPSEKQLAFAEESGAELVMVPIGKEAFVFIANEKNPIETLTVEQIKGIYSGQYVNWSQVGGGNYPINALQRAEGSGSQTAMQAFMKDSYLKKNTTNILGKSIGFSFRFYVTDLAGKSGVKTIAVNGIEPTEENIRNGSYPITDMFYAIYRADNDNPNIPLLVDWVISDEGQKIVNDTGYVGING